MKYTMNGLRWTRWFKFPAGLLCCLAGFIFNSHSAQVLIPLQTCGISPAANRQITLTPLQALGSNSIPLMDKIQGATDLNGNWQPGLLPGVYQADVRPAWGQVGVTEFCFYVDPTNAVQNAFTNLLTGTNNTWPPNQYAYSAQASDARYIIAPANSNQVLSINPSQIYPPVSGGAGATVTSSNKSVTVVASASGGTTNYDLSIPNVITNTQTGTITLSGVSMDSGAAVAPNGFYGPVWGPLNGTSTNALALNGMMASQFSQYASANMRGVLYYKTNWSNLGDFLCVTDNAMDFYITNNPQGKLILATGDSYWANYLLITNMIGNGISDGENYSMAVNFNVLGSPQGNYTFFIGKTSANSAWNLSTLNTISGSGFFQISTQNKTGNFASDSAFTIASSNNVTVIWQVLGDKISIFAQNNNSNYCTSYTVTEFPTNNNQNIPPNTGWFAIHDTGGTPVQINWIKITDYSPTNAPWAIIGDSVVEGEMSENREYRLASILQKRIGTPIDVFSGGGDRTYDVSNDLPYILSFHPQNVLLRVGRNDFILGPGWSLGSYTNIVNQLTNAGINVYNLCAEPDNNGSYTTLNTFLLTNYSSTTIPIFNWNASIMLSSDGVHPNPLGYQCLADDVSAFLPQFATRCNQTEYHPLDTYQLIPLPIFTTNAPYNGATLRYTNGGYYWGL